MPTAYSKVEQGAETVKHLIRIGRRLFSKHGYHDVAAEVIVEKARLTRGALYHHFGGKRGLFEAVFVDCEQEIAQRIEQSSRKKAAPRDQLIAGSLAFLDACADPGLRRVVIEDAPTVLGWSRWRDIDATHGFALLRSVIDRLAKNGELNGYRPEPLAYLLSGAMNELAMWVAESDNPRANLKAAKHTLGAMVAALGH